MKKTNHLSHESDKPMNRCKICLRALLYFLPVLLLSLGVVAFILISSGHTEVNYRRSGQNHAVDFQVSTIKSDLAEAVSDLSILAHAVKVGGLWDNDGKISQEALEHAAIHYPAFLKHRQRYDHVRLIDESGMEVLRVNFNEGKPVIVPKEQLRNKKGHYYFADSFELEKGLVYISPIDLNVDPGVIDIPAKPMIRFAIPIFDQNDKKRGVVILNYLGTCLLKRFDHLPAGSQSILLKSDGGWLASTASRVDKTFARTHNQAWKKIKSAEAGQFITSDGMYTFRTLYPQIEGRKANQDQDKAYIPSDTSRKSEKYYWKFISFTPLEHFRVTSNARMVTAGAILVLLTLIMLPVSWLLARSSQLRKQAKMSRIARMHNFESMNRINMAIHHTSDMKRMMSDVLQEVLGIFDADRAWLLYPCDPEAESWSVPMERTKPQYPGAFAIGEEIPTNAEHIIAFRKALDSDDAITYDYPDSDDPQNFYRKFSIRSEMHLALHPPTGKPWVFGIHQCSHQHQWLAEEKYLFRSIGRRIEDSLGREILLHDMRERMKELQCLYGISQSIQMRTSTEEIFQDVANLLPTGWQYPEIARGKVIFDDVQYISAPFTETRWRQSANIIVNGKVRGSIAVYYLQQKPDSDEGPFMSEERNLLDGIARTLREAIEHRQAEVDRLHLERQMLHAQKLESLGVLAGGIAHDFNNLLTVILGNAELALHDLSPHAPARSNLHAIQKTSQRAAELAKQMLAYSGKGRFMIEPINLREFITEMTHLLEVSISKKAVLKYNFADNLPVFDGDTTQIRQIIMNMITNASEAIADKSGVIAISTGAMDCDHAYLESLRSIISAGADEPLPEGLYVYIEVADTGCGMDKETLGKIFDPFFTTKFTGRGLGMAAALGIVRGHGGAIKVYSEIGKGTSFKVLFPVSPSAKNAAIQQHMDMGNSDMLPSKGTVLIVDDEDSVCAVGKQILTAMGLDVLTASDGIEAVKIFSEHPNEIDCVLLDLTMPHMDGEQAFCELRRIKSDVVVILCSGYNEQDATQRFVGKGLAGFLQKPYSMKAIREKLIAVIGNR